MRRLAQAAIPGDGCGVGYVTTSAGAPVLDVETRHIGAYAGDMTVMLDDGRKYWEPGESQLRIGFTEAGVAKVLARGNRLVPEVVTDLCGRLGVATTEIDVFITNQPNRTFLRNWREALQLPAERHLHTFDQCGNLFGAAIPITLDRAIRSQHLEDGDLVVLGDSPTQATSPVPSPSAGAEGGDEGWSTAPHRAGAATAVRRRSSSKRRW